MLLFVGYDPVKNGNIVGTCWTKWWKWKYT